VVPPLVMATTDGGQSWQSVPFDCPASGACVRWGAAPSGIGSCNMHGYGQPLLVSQDGGQTWTSPEGARAVNACHPNELALISDHDVLLLAPGGEEVDGPSAPIVTSHDGGRTFAPPSLPDQPAALDLFELHLLPDERLLARVSGQTPGPGWTWQLLSHSDEPPAGDRWCRAADIPLSPSAGLSVRVAGDRLWWVGRDGQAASLPLTDLRC
jgi:photosystem II stability/assembly factor-like uncharacterized protein